MPIPFIIGAIAAVSAIAGAGCAINNGVSKMYNANRLIEKASEFQKKQDLEFNRNLDIVNKQTEKLAKLEIAIMQKIGMYSELRAAIVNLPDENFEGLFSHPGVREPLPKDFNQSRIVADKLIEQSETFPAGLLGGLAVAGMQEDVLNKFLNEGSEVISKHVYATLGCKTIGLDERKSCSYEDLSTVTGMGLLTDSIVYNFVGDSVIEHAEQHLNRVQENAKKTERIVSYIQELNSLAEFFYDSLERIFSNYNIRFENVKKIIDRTPDYYLLNSSEQLILENLHDFSKVIFKMIRLPLIKMRQKGQEIPKLNREEINIVVEGLEQRILGYGIY